MSLNRLLLQPKLPFIPALINRLPKSERWCSSSPSTNAQKPPSSRKRIAATAVEDSDKKCAERQLYRILCPISVQEEMGKTFVTLKEFFGNFKRIVSAAAETVSEVTKTKSSPEDSQIGPSDNSIPMLKVITDSESCGHNISKTSDVVGDNSSSDLLDATMERKPGVRENKSTSDTVWTSSVLKSAGLVASDGKRVHGDHKDVEHCRKKSSFEDLELIMDSLNNVESVTETASSNLILESPSKSIGQSEESRRQLEMGISRSDFDCVSSLSCVLLSEVSKKMQNDIGKVSSVIGNGNPQRGKEAILDQQPTAGADVGKMPSSFSGPQPKQRLGNIIKKTINGRKDGVVRSVKSDTLASDGVLNTSNQTNDVDIDGMIKCLHGLARSSTGAKNTDLSEKVGSAEKAQGSTNVKENDVKRKERSLRVDVISKLTSKQDLRISGTTCLKRVSTENEVEKVESSTNVKESDVKIKESSLRVDVIGKLNSQEVVKIPGTSCLKRVSTENKVLVRFLDKSVKKRFIVEVFGDCGCIKRVELLPLIKGSLFRAGYVHFEVVYTSFSKGTAIFDFLPFETVEGSHKALTKSGIFIDGHTIIVDANSFNHVLTETAIPNLIGSPEVPLMLVKSPRRTVMIKHLTHDISINQLKEALAFCGTGISAVFFGLSSSVAYVEFETEDAKERVIAANSIIVQEKQLLILRIDVPRTTVIRITGVDDTLFSDKKMVSQIQSICGTFAEGVKVQLRNIGVLDVYFQLNQWPNMLSILNRLNGMEVDGHRLIAQPAPIFPPLVLQILWSKPDGRTYVKSVLRKLLQNTDLPVELSNLATTYHGDKYFD